MLRKKLKVEAGKTYTVRDAAATYTIIVGDLNESSSTPASPTASDSLFNVGIGAPSLNLGKSGSVYFDSVNRKIYTKDVIGWDAGFDLGGSGSGLNGSNGRTTLEGSGPPSDSAVYAAALSEAGITASDVQNGDLYLDTLNHVFYKRVSGAWASRSSHKGQRGRTIFEGSGDPDDPNSELPSDISDASEGDLYHDVVNFKWHRRNSSGIPGSRWDARSTYLGSIGPIGPNGLNGLGGLNGNDGRTTIEGAGLPTNATVYAAALADAGVEESEVKNGDLYLDTLNHVFYKRTSGSWVSRTSHKGRNGRTIFEGSGDPDDPASELPSDIGDAVAGDLYHDVTNFRWHRRNSSSTSGSKWDSRSVYLGPIGPIGPNGLNGDKGADGDPGADGKNGVSAQLTNDSDVISADSDGSGYDFTDTGGEFEIRSGGTKVTSGVTYYAGASGTGSTSTVNGLTLTISSSGAYSLSGASWTQNFARFTMRAIYDGVTYTKVYKATKARSGLKGSDGMNGSNGLNGINGSNGKDGADGADALTGYLSNEADVLSAASDGTGYSLVGMGGTFYVYSGKTLVSPSNFYAGATGTSTTQTISGLTLSVNSSGVYSLSGASWTSDTASFTLRALYSGVTLTKTYKITKSKAGSKGDKGTTGDPGVTGEGINKYVDSLASGYSLAASTPRKLYYNDLVSDVGSVVAKSGDATSGSTFTISSSGRYKVDLSCGFKAIYAAGTSVNYSVKLLVNDVVKRTVTGTNSSVLGSETRYPNLDLSWMGFLPSGTTIKCEVERTSAGSNPTLYATAINKLSFSAAEEDTTISITKL